MDIWFSETLDWEILWVIHFQKISSVIASLKDFENTYWVIKINNLYCKLGFQFEYHLGTYIHSTLFVIIVCMNFRARNDLRNTYILKLKLFEISLEFRFSCYLYKCYLNFARSKFALCEDLVQLCCSEF